METNRKIIVTLKESIRTGYHEMASCIYCDSIWADTMSSPQVVSYKIGETLLSLPIHNFLGSHLNENYKSE